MYCQKCQKNVSEGKYCSNCGELLQEKKVIKNKLKKCITILSTIYLIYIIIILPILLSGTDNVSGGLYLFFGPIIFYFTCCIPITIAIALLNMNANNNIINFINCILNFITFILLVFNIDWIGIDEDTYVIFPIYLIIIITILSIIYFLKILIAKITKKRVVQ